MSKLLTHKEEWPVTGQGHHSYPRYPPFFDKVYILEFIACKVFLMGFNYTSTDWSEGIWSINLQAYLGSTDKGVNVTSHITSFPDPANADSRILVFGVRFNTDSRDSLYHTSICPQCSVGVNSILMAVRRSAVYTEKPDVLWMAQLPTQTSQVKGQVIGAGDKMVAYVVEESGEGKVVAFK